MTTRRRRGSDKAAVAPLGVDYGVNVRAADGGHDGGVGAGKHVAHIGGNASSRPFEQRLLAGPQEGELEVGVGGREDEVGLTLAHGVADEGGLGLADAFDVYADGAVADGARHSRLAVTEVEVYAGVLREAGLAVFPVMELRRLRDAILPTKPTAQEGIGKGALTAHRLVGAAAQALPPLPGEPLYHGGYLLGGEAPRVVVDVYHRSLLSAMRSRV